MSCKPKPRLFNIINHDPISVRGHPNLVKDHNSGSLPNLLGTNHTKHEKKEKSVWSEKDPQS